MSIKSELKFSVVTIVYNGQDYIEKTMKSVLDLDYDHVEYIIIDGASSDSTMNIIKKYASKIAFVHSEKDSGLYDAMNTGLSYCTGDYVIFMNGGDKFYDSSVLKKVSDRIRQEDVEYDFLYGDSYIDTILDKQLLYKKARNYKYFWYGMFANHQSMFYNLSIIRKYDLKFDITYKISADYKFTIQFISCSNTILYLNFPVCVYLLGGISIVNRNLGLLEADHARAEILNYNIFHRQLIKVMIYSARFVEDYLKPIHKILRYK